MYHVITSSYISAISDEFVLSHIAENSSGKYDISVYIDSDTDPDEFSDYLEEFEDDPMSDYNFKITSVSTLEEALGMIAHDIAISEQSTLKESEDTNDTPEEINVVCSCKYGSNHMITQELNSALREEGSDITCLDIFQYLKAPTDERLAEIICNNLHIETCYYNEDPIAFGYAVMIYISGKVSGTL